MSGWKIIYASTSHKGKTEQWLKFKSVTILILYHNSRCINYRQEHTESISKHLQSLKNKVLKDLKIVSPKKGLFFSHLKA